MSPKSSRAPLWNTPHPLSPNSNVSYRGDDFEEYQRVVLSVRTVRYPHIYYKALSTSGECSGSVVECLTWDRGVAGWSHNGVTYVVSFSKTPHLILSLLSTSSTQEDRYRHN